jgi:hypothetical protein
VVSIGVSAGAAPSAKPTGLLASRSAPDCAGSGGAARSVGAAPGSMSTGAGGAGGTN